MYPKFLKITKGAVLLFAFMLALSTAVFSQGNGNFLSKSQPSNLSNDISEARMYAEVLKNENTKSAQWIKLGKIEKLQKQGALPIKIPGRNGALVMKATNVEYHSDDNFIWHGELIGKTHGSMTIISKNGSRFGQINVEEETYKIFDTGDSNWLLVEMDNNIQGSFDNDVIEVSPDEIETEKPTKGNGAKNNWCSVAKVLFCYTDAAETLVNPQQVAELAISETNIALSNSNVPSSTLRVELAGVVHVPHFVEGSNMNVDIGVLRNDNIIQQLRNTMEADIVVLLEKPNDPYGPAGLTYNLYTGNPNFAYVTLQALTNNFTAAHEFGHVFGIAHNTESLSDVGPARGYDFYYRTWFLGRKKDVKTVVASGGTQGTRLLRYSNPHIEYEGRDTGVENLYDGVEAIEDNACNVASFRGDASPPMTAFIFGPVSMINGVSATWNANVSNCSNITSYSWQWSDDGFNYSTAGGNSSSLSRSFFPTDNDRVFLRLTAYCSDGSSASAFHTVYLNNYIYLTESPSKVTAINKSNGTPDTVFDNLKVSPNPASDFISLEFWTQNDNKVELSLVDLSGKTVKRIFSGKLPAGGHRFTENVSSFPKGSYISVLKSKEGTQSVKLILQ